MGRYDTATKGLLTHTCHAPQPTYLGEGAELQTLTCEERQAEILFPQTFEKIHNHIPTLKIYLLQKFNLKTFSGF